LTFLRLNQYLNDLYLRKAVLPSPFYLQTVMMKRFYLTAWLVLISGVIFQFLQMPGSAIILLAGGLLFLIHLVVFLSKEGNSALYLSFFYTLITLINIYLIGRLHFWFFSKIVFYLALLTALLSVIIYFVKKQKHVLMLSSSLIYMLLMIMFSWVRPYQLYYAIRLNTFLNNESRKFDYRSWDKYSFFLYRYDKIDEAYEANKHAMEPVTYSKEKLNDAGAEQFMNLTRQHQFQIVHQQWTDYP
jgi:hypothetical protein